MATNPKNLLAASTIFVVFQYVILIIIQSESHILCYVIQHSNHQNHCYV